LNSFDATRALFGENVMKRDVELGLLARTRAPALALALGCALTACGDGVGRPLAPILEAAGEGGAGGVPEQGHCDATEDWPAQSTQAEEDLFTIISAMRQAGLDCTGEQLNPVPALIENPALRCAARLHSRDMGERGFFSHINPEALDPQARMERAGHRASVFGESIARESAIGGDWGDWGPLEGLLPGPECENLFDPRFNAVGIGHYDGLWTLDFAGD
jgi:uncharacterized protein YkwD